MNKQDFEKAKRLEKEMESLNDKMNLLNECDEIVFKSNGVACLITTRVQIGCDSRTKLFDQLKKESIDYLAGELQAVESKFNRLIED